SLVDGEALFVPTAAYSINGKCVNSEEVEELPTSVTSAVVAIRSRPWSRMRFGPSPALTSRPARSMSCQDSQPFMVAPTLAGGGRRPVTRTRGRGFWRATANSGSSVGVAIPEQSHGDIGTSLQRPDGRDHLLEHGVAFDDREDVRAVAQAGDGRFEVVTAGG